MARYPTSVLRGSATDAFRTVLQMRTGAGQVRVLDPTYGEGISWGAPTLFDEAIEVVKSDIKMGQDIFTAVADRQEWHEAFDLIYYDPPWFIDCGTESGDPRAETYGGYGEQPLQRFIEAVHDLKMFLRPHGELIVKCSDQYHVPTRRLLLHHLDWCAELRAAEFDLADFYIYPYHRVSPTAYQVKDRPCAVVAHSYFVVGKLG